MRNNRSLICVQLSAIVRRCIEQNTTNPLQYVNEATTTKKREVIMLANAPRVPEREIGRPDLPLVWNAAILLLFQCR